MRSPRNAPGSTPPRPQLRRNRLVALILAVTVVPVVALSGGTAQALAPTPVFAPYLNYEVGHGHSVVIADLTGDGRNDVLISSEDPDWMGRPDDDHLRLFVQGSDGWFARVETFDTRLRWRPEGGLAAGDIDGDGKSDAVLATGDSLELYLQKNGTLAPPAVVPLPGAQTVVVADVDGDGRLDLVVNTSPDPVSGAVVLLRGVGGGQFGPPTVIVAEPQVESQVGDVTGDGRPDIVTCAYHHVRVYAQANDGSFLAPLSYLGDVNCKGLALGDFDGDGRLDVAFPGGGNRPSSRVDVLSQRADGTFAPATTYRTADIPDAIAAGDMNGDGLTDVVVLHDSWELAGVHTQAPDHSLDPERLFVVPYSNLGQPKRLAVGDVTGDGRPDIVAADDQHGLIVLRNQIPRPSTTTSTSMLPTRTPTVPVPGPSAPLFSAPQAYDVSSDPKTIATGDFNGDGRIDVATATSGPWDPDNDEKVFVFLAGPDGSPAKSVRYDTDAEGSDVIVLSAGDLDGDGLTDLVLRMREGVDVFLQRDGGFIDRKFIELPYASQVDVVDLDDDGTAEMIMSGSSGVSVYRSLGGHAFAPPTVVSAAYQGGLAVGDVTGDGRPDLVTTTAGSALDVFRQQSDGSFAEGARYSLPGQFTGSIAVGDVTSDARPDVVVSAGTTGGPISLLRINVLAQTAAGTLAAPVAYENFQPESLRVGDVNGDGAGDLVTVHGGSELGVLLQRPDHTLAPELTMELPYATRYPETGMVVTDLTGDGRPEVALADYNNGLVLLRNVAPRSIVDQVLAYLDQVFGDLLGRAPTAAEVATWSPTVTSGHGRVVLAVTLVSGAEYRTRRIAEEALPRLGHAPVAGDLAALLGAIVSGVIVEIAPALFLGSNEFYARSGSTPEGFVDALIFDLLGVQADPAGRAALAGAIRGGYDRTSLAVLFLLHPATRGRMVDLAYQRYLGRAPDAANRAVWVDAITNGGMRSEYLVAYLVSLDVYWNRAIS
ncbi:MAG: hypothetical protein QOE93_2478 [Actinomycetota bacterium]|nr:hypothetical protein [Actinomycetota bacterium]